MQKKLHKVTNKKEHREWEFVVMCHMQLVEKCVNNMKLCVPYKTVTTLIYIFIKFIIIYK